MQLNNTMQKALNQVAGLSAERRNASNSSIVLLQEMAKYGHKWRHQQSKAFQKALADNNIRPSARTRNQWLDVCKLVRLYAEETHGGDFGFLNGFASYLRHFDANGVPPEAIPEYVKTYNDAEFGKGMTAIKLRDTKDNRIEALRRQGTVKVDPKTGFTVNMQVAITALGEELAKYQSAEGGYPEKFEQLLIGRINSITKYAPKLNAQARP